MDFSSIKVGFWFGYKKGYTKQQMVSGNTSSTYDEAIQRLMRLGISRKVSKGTIIFHQGEVPQAAAILKSGVVKVYNLSPAGEEQLVAFHIAGEVFPSTWLFGQTPGTLYFYEAFHDAEIVFLPRQTATEAINSSDDSLRAFLDYYVKSYTANMLRITALQQAKADTKIAYTIFYLCQRYGKSLGSQYTRISLPLTHQQFASLVGLTRETTATEMKKLETAGIVSYKSQIYKVHERKLLEYMGDESFNDVRIA